MRAFDEASLSCEQRESWTKAFVDQEFRNQFSLSEFLYTRA